MHRHKSKKEHHEGTGKGVRGFVPNDFAQNYLRGMSVQKAWRLAREAFPDDREAQEIEYRRLIRGDG